jgi:hypothetical protein
MLVRRATEMQNIIQFSQPAPVAADSAEAALDLVFDQLVLDETPKSFRSRRRTAPNYEHAPELNGRDLSPKQSRAEERLRRSSRSDSGTETLGLASCSSLVAAHVDPGPSPVGGRSAYRMSARRREELSDPHRLTDRRRVRDAGSPFS